MGERRDRVRRERRMDPRTDGWMIWSTNRRMDESTCGWQMERQWWGRNGHWRRKEIWGSVLKTCLRPALGNTRLTWRRFKDRNVLNFHNASLQTLVEASRSSTSTSRSNPLVSQLPTGFPVPGTVDLHVYSTQKRETRLVHTNTLSSWRVSAVTLFKISLFSSGHDPAVAGLSPTSGSVPSVESASDSRSLSAHLPPPQSWSLSPSNK